MSQKIRLSLLTLVGALVLILAACGGTTSPTSAPPTSAPAAQPTSAPAAQPTTAPAAQPTTAPSANANGCDPMAANQAVTMWSPLTGPDGKFMSDLAARFTAENGMGITVTHLPQPEYMAKLQAAAAAQNLPELSIIHYENLAELVIRGVAKPWTPEVTAAIGDAESDFPAELWAAGEYNGQRYLLPLDVHPLVLYYNKDMFTAAGLPLPGTTPMTREEFETAVETLNKDGVAGISLGTAFQTSAWFQALIRQFGGTMANADGTKATYNSDAGVQALQYIADMRQKYSPGPSGAGDPEVKVFQQGKAAMVLHGPWHITDMEKLGFVGYAPMPQIGDTYAVWGGSHEMVLTTADPAKAAAAGCWMSWLSKNSLEWAKAGQVPIRESVRNSADLATQAGPISAVAESAASVSVWPKVPGVVGALWGEGSEQAINAVLLGQKTDIKAALDEAAAKSDQILLDNAERYKP
jgi:multiple sugar transport system substrate-binding protein